MVLSSPWLVLGLLLPSARVATAQSPGSIVQAGSTLVSAMMMFLGNEQIVYILDKTEGNAATINGHPAWGSYWDIQTHQADVMEVYTNTFCAGGSHLPNGSYATFGGNGAIGPNGTVGDVLNAQGTGAYDTVYGDYSGSKSIRILNPCVPGDDFSSPQCAWFDNATFLAMQKERWYPGVEPLANGTIALIGGFVNGGYINRNTINSDPAYEGGAAEPTVEFYPSLGEPFLLNFMVETSGLNSFAHTFMMPSGKMFMQANVSTMLWDYDTNTEYPLPTMPGNVARVYPASGATAMLPLTPANNWTPTIIFCGGSNMSWEDYGNYSFPLINTWEYPASADCQRITPEPQDGSDPVYVQDDDMLEERTMGQFIILPDGNLLVINGGLNGTAGYSTATGSTPSLGFMPFGESLASGPVGTPAIYYPNNPSGSRWSNAGLETSSIARLYHSSALLLPDASVLVAGGNPNIDVNVSTIYPTEYTAEIFYPPYFSASVRPQPQGMPTNISYGGSYFNITVPASSYTGDANDAADNTTVVLARPGFTTHAMNMGQRHVQLNNTYTVNSDGSYVLHVAQAPPNANLLQPGPCLLFVVIAGIPSNGTMVLVGTGQVEEQPLLAVSELPPVSQLSVNSTTSQNGSSGSSASSSSNTGAIIGGIVGGIVAIGLLGALFGVCIARRRRAARAHSRGVDGSAAISYPMSSRNRGISGPIAAGGAAAGYGGRSRTSDSSALVPLHQDNSSSAWNMPANASSANLHTPYRDDYGYYDGRRSVESSAHYSAQTGRRPSTGQRF